MKEIFECGGQKRTFIRQIFPIWADLISDEIYTLKIILPKDLKIHSIINYNRKPKLDKLNNSYTFLHSQFKSDRMAVFEMVFLKHIEKSIDSNIIFQVFNIDGKLLSEKSYITKIIIPEISVEIKKREQIKGGFVNIKITSLNRTVFKIKGLSIAVYEHGTNNSIEIKKRKMPLDEYLDIIKDLPPQIDPQHYIGRLTIPKDVDVDIEIGIYVADLKENKFMTYSNRLHLTKVEIPMFEEMPYCIPEIFA
jgi:hypothetical protein